MLKAQVNLLMNNHPLQDGDARERALDPASSFIVQAPAGSGKTELLTQRYLVLLNHVSAPEEILAITFTKKSAREMRFRIIKTLKNAAITHEPPEASHSLQTWKLGKKVLERDRKLNWNLLSNPNRLRIQTIDSFNASLTKRLPIMSRFGSTPEITDQPDSLYNEAIGELLSHLEDNVEWSDLIATLLTHVDNDLNKVRELLVNMLAKRDQWLPNIGDQSRHILEKTLQDIVSDKLTLLTKKFPKEWLQTLCDSLRYAAENLAESAPDSPLIACRDITKLPGCNQSSISQWKAITHFLLTKDNTPRSKLTKTEGFPTKKDAQHIINPDEYKANAAALLYEFSQREDLQNHFIDLRHLPNPSYDDAQWEVLQSLMYLLKVAVAQLHLIFQKYGKIDYIENSLAGLKSLGTDDDPTDLALSLDYKIQHILVDEFQDTANNQYELLKKLTMGWQSNDGRTLFVVGDPMQSIYRFREAEVGLFIQCKNQGLGNIYLEPLTLTVNFRSTHEIVSWVNESFTHVFPNYNDIPTGAVTYSRSTSHQSDTTLSQAVFLHPFINSTSNHDQAQKIIDIILHERKENPKKKIAILVRTRGHLHKIIPALKSANLAFRAIKIDALNSRVAIQDLISLTRALLHPADRIAWLATLRAPWCGLSLNDLHILSNNAALTVWEQLNNAELISTLSSNGKSQVRRVLPIIKHATLARRRHSLRNWIESTWILLGGPACITQLSELDDAKAYFNLLESIDFGGDINHIDLLEDAVNSLFATPDTKSDDTLQIMTIHNSKGLEFDTVIIPHLEKGTRPDDKQLLRWMQSHRKDGTQELIIAPVHSTGSNEDKIYEYIKQQSKIKSQFEDGRLLYVAVTRAKKTLHLLFSAAEKEDKKGVKTITPAANSLLEKLWPAIQSTIKPQYGSSLSQSTPAVAHPKLCRLLSSWKNPIDEDVTSTAIPPQTLADYNIAETKHKIVGTITHQILQQLANHGIAWWNSFNNEDKHTFIKLQLRRANMPAIHIAPSAKIIFDGVKSMLTDARARWILHPHTASAAEMPLTTMINQEPQSLIIDRTFIDEDGTRWIIDYKTTIFTANDLEIFLAHEKEKYESQLRAYEKALRNIESNPIKLALYFPFIPAWKEWE